MTLELTGREEQVCMLVCEGCSNATIAEALGIETSTVKAHLDRIYIKLGAFNRGNLAAIYTRATLEATQD